MVARVQAHRSSCGHRADSGRPAQFLFDEIYFVHLECCVVHLIGSWVGVFWFVGCMYEWLFGCTVD